MSNMLLLLHPTRSTNEQHALASHAQYLASDAYSVCFCIPYRLSRCLYTNVHNCSSSTVTGCSSPTFAHRAGGTARLCQNVAVTQHAQHAAAELAVPHPILKGTSVCPCVSMCVAQGTCVVVAQGTCVEVHVCCTGHARRQLNG